MIDFFPLYPLTEEHLNGQLAFEITNPPGDWTHLADFQFDLDIPVYPH